MLNTAVVWRAWQKLQIGKDIMTEENATPTAESNTPAFRLQKLYVKDLSFENPNAPEVFQVKQGEPKTEVNLNMKNKRLSEDVWEVSLGLTVKIAGNDDKTLFIIEVEHAGAFMIKNIPAEHMPMVLNVECPNIMLPFTRQIISQATVDGGFMPFLIEPINFLALYQNAKKKQEGGEEAKQ